MSELNKEEKEVRFSAAECFRAALVHFLNKDGYGAQVALARAIGRGTKHLNDVVQRRRNASMEFQERVALFYDMTLEEMLAHGRHILREGIEPFPYADEVKKFPERRDRAEFIYEKAIEEAGLKENRFFSGRLLRDVMPADLDVYVRGSMKDYELYTKTKEELKLIAETVNKHLLQKRKRSRKEDKKSEKS
jgi:hypothetical protein